jgi:hypothetical protein
MKIKFASWAAGVSIPENASAEMESLFRRAYESGVRAGRESVRQPIIDALGLDDMYQEKQD